MDAQTGKRRLIYTLELLCEQTDEKHPLSLSECIAYLKEKGVYADRKTVRADIALLIEMGMDIVEAQGKPVRFFAGSRRFELPEVRLLIDAVSSSRFITRNKSERLVEKLKALVSVHQAGAMECHIHLCEGAKPVNENIYYSMDTLCEAMLKDHKVQFQYIEYTPAKEKSLKHGGYRYAFSPYDLVWSDDHYYAIGYSEKHACIAAFRVDRMNDVRLTQEQRRPTPDGYAASSFSSEVFGMFSGERTRVELCCENTLMKAVIDRFGEGVTTEQIDRAHFKAIVDVHVSPTFFGWLVQFSGRIKIISPTQVKEQFIAVCQAAIS